jgi:hypothetical protein
MDSQPLHRLYHHFSEMPYSQRVLFTCTLLVLALGYLFALTLIFVTYAGRAGGNPLMLSYQDIVVAYSGSGEASRLESALGGPMRTMLPPDERATIVTWLHQGVARAAFTSDVSPILAKRCLICHDGSNPHIPNLTGYDNIKKVTESDTGTPIPTLIRVSHIHLFGITVVFFVMGSMFSHAYVRPVWLKCAIIATPFVAIVSDVSSWYFIKLYHPFGWVVIGGGALMASCFAFMWLTTMYQMWFSKPPRMVLERSGDLPIKEGLNKSPFNRSGH